MPTVHDKVTRIIAVKADIKAAIEAKGPTVGSIPFDEYAGKIADIPDISTAQTAVEAVNGETSTDFTTAIALTASTKLAIEAAIETAGVDVPALTVFADYADYVADVAALAGNEKLFKLNPANGHIVAYGYNGYQGPKDVVIPATIGGVAVVAILDYSFAFTPGQDGLLSAYIPDSVAYIGGAAFGYQPAITSVRLPINAAFTTLKQATFQECSLTEIDIPASVTDIGLYCFYGNPIIKIIIGANVTINANETYPAMGTYGSAFRAFYDGNGKLAGTYEYAAGTWSKTA